jgi:hypothetical protein
MVGWYANSGTGGSAPVEMFRINTPTYVQASGSRTVIGAEQAGTNSCKELTIYGFAGGTGAITNLSDVKRYYQRVARAKGMVAMDISGVTTTHNYRMDGSTTVVNQGSSGASSDITTLSGTVLTAPLGLRKRWLF